MSIQLQAVILGGGNAQLLYPLCKEQSKSLLFVGNKPLIAYQLEWLEQQGIKETIIIVSKHQKKLESYLISQYKGKIKCRLETVSDELDSAQALNEVRKLV